MDLTAAIALVIKAYRAEDTESTSTDAEIVAETREGVEPGDMGFVEERDVQEAYVMVIMATDDEIAAARA